jgi:hypothetical protein
MCKSTRAGSGSGWGSTRVRFPGLARGWVTQTLGGKTSFAAEPAGQIWDALETPKERGGDGPGVEADKG